MIQQDLGDPHSAVFFVIKDSSETNDIIKNEASGRKLEFMLQELGREFNTISSKINDAEIQAFNSGVLTKERQETRMVWGVCNDLPNFDHIWSV